MDAYINIERKLNKLQATFGGFSYGGYRLRYSRGAGDVLVLTDTGKNVFLFEERRSARKYAAQKLFLADISVVTAAAVPVYEHIASDIGCIVYPNVSGVPITPEFLAEAGGEKQALMGKAIGRFLKAVHSMPCSKYGLEWGRMEKVKADMKRSDALIEKYVSPIEAGYASRFLERYFAACEPFDAECVIHGGFAFENIIWDEEKGSLGVIGFHDCIVGDPAIDFAFIMHDTPAEFRAAVCEGYGLSPDGIAVIESRSRLHMHLSTIYELVWAVEEKQRAESLVSRYRSKLFTLL